MNTDLMVHGAALNNEHELIYKTRNVKTIGLKAPTAIPSNQRRF